MMTKLPKIAEIDASSSGWGFFLCARKDVRTGRSGEYLTLVLQDVSGEIRAKVFQDVDALKEEFSAGEFVKVQGRGNSFNQQVELVLDKIRRVMPDRDAADGFREDECVLCAPRPAAEMWQELLSRIEQVSEPSLHRLLGTIVQSNKDRLINWPAALNVHHAYRSGLLEHILKILETSIFLSNAYIAKTDLVIAGAILHDIGKLQELTYDTAAGYSVPGNLLGHIAIGFGVLRDAVRSDPGFPPDLALELEHLVLSHHGSKENGSPVEPMTVEAFILAMADDLDAKIHQVRRHVAEDDSGGPFTSYHKRLGRVLFKGQKS